MTDKTKKQAPATELSKKELVRRAIGHLGREAKPLQIQAHIKDQFGVEMTPNHISASKTEVLREAGGAKPAAAKPATTKAPAVENPAAKSAAAKAVTAAKPAAKISSPKKAVSKTAVRESVVAATAGGSQAGNGNVGISLQDIQAAKDLVGRVGARQLLTLIDLLAK